MVKHFASLKEFKCCFGYLNEFLIQTTRNKSLVKVSALLIQNSCYVRNLDTLRWRFLNLLNLPKCFSIHFLQRDVHLEHKTANWIANLLQDTPAENEDFDDWIKDGKILCRVINNLMFNAVPTDIVSVTSNDVEVKNTILWKL